VADHLPLDEAAAEVLRSAERHAALAALRLARATARLSAVLADAGVDHLVYKGVPLAVQTTGSMTARGWGDIDLLVAPAEIVTAHEALLAAGATFSARSVPAPGSSLWRHAVRVRAEAPYRWDDVDVDLHWRFDTSPQVMAVPFEVLRNRHEEVAVGGATVLTLGRRDALLVTAVHGTKEHWRELRWVVDAARQVSAVPAAEWDEIRVQAREVGALPGLGVMLAVAARLLPPGAGRPSPSHRAQRIGDEVWRECLDGTAPFQAWNQRSHLAKVSFAWRTAPNLRARLDHVGAALVTAEDMAVMPLPPALVPLYVPLRPVLRRRRQQEAARAGVPL
jgi:hypothetical protein